MKPFKITHSESLEAKAGMMNYKAEQTDNPRAAEQYKLKGKLAKAKAVKLQQTQGLGKE